MTRKRQHLASAFSRITGGRKVKESWAIPG